MNVMLWIYALLVIFWVVLLLLVNVPHTYFWHLLQPGTLLSLRYRSLLSIALILSALRLFVPVFARALLRFRKSRECSWAWLTTLGIVAVIDLLVFLFLLGQFGGANQPGDYYNVCNDAAYCCVFYMDSRCPRTGPCLSPSIVQSELQRNGLCQALFYTSIPFMVLSMALFMWPFFLWIFPTSRISELRPSVPRFNYASDTKQQPDNVAIKSRVAYTSARHDINHVRRRNNPTVRVVPVISLKTQ